MDGAWDIRESSDAEAGTTGRSASCSDSERSAEQRIVAEDPYVHFGVYMAGTRALSSFEEDLRMEFLQMEIYLVRGVDVRDVDRPTENMAELLAFSFVVHGQAKWNQLQRLIDLLPCDKTLRWQQADAEQHQISPKRFTTGAWVRGPMTGTTLHAKDFPWTTRALASIISTWDSSLQFSAVTMSMNVQAKPHKDSFNHPRSRNLVLPPSRFTGGQVFIEDVEGLHRLTPDGVTGHLLSASEPLSFMPRQLHATLPWCGTRLVLIAYHTGMSQNLQPADRSVLRRMGFQLGDWTS